MKIPTREARLSPDHPGATSPKANASGKVVLKLDRLIRSSRTIRSRCS